LQETVLPLAGIAAAAAATSAPAGAEQQQQHPARPLLRRMNAFPARTVTCPPDWGLDRISQAGSDSNSSSSSSDSSSSNAAYSGRYNGYVPLSEEAAAAVARMLPDGVVLSVGYQQMLD
jgi:hypothetical protein